MANEKYIALLKKVKALAEQGVGGEKYNAEKALKILMKKYGITEEMLDDEKVSYHFFWLRKDYEQELFKQLIGCYYPDLKPGAFPLKLAKQYNGNYFVECTKAGYIEIKARLEFYFKGYMADLKVFYRAFLYKNNLLVESKRTEFDVTPEELEEHKKAVKMAQGIEKRAYNKQLNGSN